MPDLTLFDVALMPIIVALVELAKRYAKLPTNYAPLLTGILSVAALWVIGYVNDNPEIATQAQFYLNALILFLTSTGFYSIVKWGAGRVRSLPFYSGDTPTSTSRGEWKSFEGDSGAGPLEYSENEGFTNLPDG